MKVIKHYNKWWWGHTISYAFLDGLALVELEVSDGKPNIAFISGLMVHESIRRNGVGTQIMHAIEDEVRRMGISILQLDVEHDSFAKEWYSRLGFYGVEENGKLLRMQKSVEIDDKWELRQKELWECGLSVRALNCLRQLNVKTVDDLTRVDRSCMMKVRNFGKKTMMEIDDFLKRNGLTWGDTIVSSNHPLKQFGALDFDFPNNITIQKNG